MEKLRPVLAIALCLGIWGIYVMVYARPKKAPQTGGPSSVQAPLGGNKTPGTTVEKPPDLVPTPVPAAFTHPTVAPELRSLDNGAIHLELTNTGASVTRVVLNSYRDAFEKDASGQHRELAVLDEFHPGFRSLALRDPAGGLPLDSVVWEVLPDAPAGEVKFRYTTPDGLRFVKTFALGPEKHAVRMKLEVENVSEGPLARGFEVIGAAGINQEASGGIYPSSVYGKFREGRTYSIDESDQSLKDLTKKKSLDVESTDVSWIGTVNKYFACVLVPLDRSIVARYKAWPVEFPSAVVRKLKAAKVSASDPKAAELKDWTVDTVATSVVVKDRTWQKGEKTSSEWLMYVGPKEDSALSEGRFLDLRLGDLLDFGWFGFISKLLLYILAGLHFVLRNWGLAVIALVLVVRCAIFPISKKAQVSMFRMQKLQPKLKAAQEKFKGDPAKVNAETMRIMKEEGVNPLGGCLPMFLQLPIFLGLYNALLKDIHLRQQPFFAWIRDLSQPDHLLDLPFNIPIHGTPELNVLPFIMMATWFIQAFMAPRSPDPQMAAQQKMFMVMPLVIGYMMYMSPSGLVLYWLVSTAWGIAEQQFIKRVYLK
ncbi:MAG: membrane protein insertase YidC [Planctomycetes bacterium]|nr:membrane protein insertase YidC [Planctomycetota bacterium]